MRRILVSVWQHSLKPSRAIELLQIQEMTRAGPFNKGEEELILGVLEALEEKIFTTSEAEKEIECILKNEKKICQT